MWGGPDEFRTVFAFFKILMDLFYKICKTSAGLLQRTGIRKSSMKNKKRLLIIGGVAGGASCAARARRLSEDVEIIVFERGQYVSFANCGLPYHVGKVIVRENALLLASPEMFKRRFNIDIRVNSNVRKIDRAAKALEVENLETGDVYKENYDFLVLSPGATPLKPPLEGIDTPGIFTLRTIPDMREIIDWIETKTVTSAVIVGGGFIGLEMAENLKHRDIGVTLIEMEKQVMPVMDIELMAFVHDYLKAKDISLWLGSPVNGFTKNDDDTIDVRVASGKSVSADMVILAIGVRPEVELAKEAGLTLGDLGGIRVDDQLRTSDERIWAVGDAIEVEDFITGAKSLVPLAGPANRQGRMAADVILGDGADTPRFRGVQGTAVCGVLGMTIAATGATEKYLKKIGSRVELEPFEKIYLHPGHHAGYYPDAKSITIKLIFSKTNGRILGAQAIGMAGVEKRIDVISMAIQKNGTVFDLAEAELCYAPQYGSAKDPVNMAGMIATNLLRGYSSIAHWEDLERSDAFLLDVREPMEFKKSGHVEGAVNIPLGDLRRRMPELPRDREIWAYCLEGQRSYYALRVLRQHGFKARNVSGGFLMHKAVNQFK
jgi:NADPH-dependent 2,4-dienoyl-CoA reductase/sulfur reductase-like enzyme/rhodanese-related sulfurtransferase